MDVTGSAFPIMCPEGLLEGGMTKLEYYAAKAMQPLIASAFAGDGGDLTLDDVARKAFLMATAMVNASDQAKVVAVSEVEQLNRKVEALESLRPIWAQGYTSDSMAAQSSGNALAAIWEFLGVDNQTDAMARLRLHYSGPKG